MDTIKIEKYIERTAQIDAIKLGTSNKAFIKHIEKAITKLISSLEKDYGKINPEDTIIDFSSIGWKVIVSVKVKVQDA